MAPIARTSAYKILISGAFGTGKSTLVKLAVAALRQAGVPTSVLGETPRRCPFALNHEQTTLASAWLIGEQMRAEVEASIKAGGILICDRGIPDILSHTTPIQSEEPQAPLKVIEEISASWATTYDLVFWAKLDPDLPIEPDNLRLSDKEYQALLEGHIEKAFVTLGLKPVVLPRSDSDRVTVVLRETLRLIS